MKVGNVEIVPVLDGGARLPLEMAVANPEGSSWNCTHQPLDRRHRVRLDIGSFLIRTGDRTVLVDLGVGPDSIHEAFVTGGLLANLNRTGVEPEDVTDVVFTHLHIDHVGWSAVDGKVTFPRATYRVHAADWAHFMTGPPADPQLDPFVRDRLAPIEAQLETFDEEAELLPGLRARPAPGHTPGSTVFIVSDADERALLLGDVAHTVAEFTDPVWEGVADVDKTAANAMRRQIAAQLEASGDAFAPAHFPELAFGRLITVDGLRQFVWADQ